MSIEHWLLDGRGMSTQRGSTRVGSPKLGVMDHNFPLSQSTLLHQMFDLPDQESLIV